MYQVTYQVLDRPITHADQTLKYEACHVGVFGTYVVGRVWNIQIATGSCMASRMASRTQTFESTTRAPGRDQYCDKNPQTHRSSNQLDGGSSPKQMSQLG